METLLDKIVSLGWWPSVAIYFAIIMVFGGLIEGVVHPKLRGQIKFLKTEDSEVFFEVGLMGFVLGLLGLLFNYKYEYPVSWHFLSAILFFAGIIGVLFQSKNKPSLSQSDRKKIGKYSGVGAIIGMVVVFFVCVSVMYFKSPNYLPLGIIMGIVFGLIGGNLFGMLFGYILGKYVVSKNK
jgi:hypothetical protein